MKKFKLLFLFVTFMLIFAMALTSCNKSSSKNDDEEHEEEDKVEDSEKDDDEGTDKESEKTKLNPFQGMSYTITGISPYCQISINNQDCSMDVQKYVTYSTDKELYANGDTAIITATLLSTKQEEYILTASSCEYTVSNQPEYITQTTGLDFSFLESELQDLIAAQCSNDLGTEFAFNENLFAWSFDDRIIADIKCLHQATYFSSLKLIRTDLMSENTPFNKLSFIYKINVTADDSSTVVLYVNISATNIVKYPNGNVKWGATSPEDYNFESITYTTSAEECIANTIISGKANYNISKIN